MSKPATRSPTRKPQVVLSALRGEISIAVAAVLCLALALGCSASRDAAPSKDGSPVLMGQGGFGCLAGSVCHAQR